MEEVNCPLFFVFLLFVVSLRLAVPTAPPVSFGCSLPSRVSDRDVRFCLLLRSQGRQDRTTEAKASPEREKERKRKGSDRKQD